jgi:hypothetical protein
MTILLLPALLCGMSTRLRVAAKQTDDGKNHYRQSDGATYWRQLVFVRFVPSGSSVYAASAGSA